ncbi:MAG: hypothetical protein ACUZ77_04085 [Candidatus Brocadiales bacterium]
MPYTYVEDEAHTGGWVKRSERLYNGRKVLPLEWTVSAPYTSICEIVTTPDKTLKGLIIVSYVVISLNNLINVHPRYPP